MMTGISGRISVHQTEGLSSAHDRHREIQQHRRDRLRVALANRFTAASPFSAVRTEYPCRSRTACAKFRTIGSSSTTKMSPLPCRVALYVHFRFRHLSGHSRKDDAERAALARRALQFQPPFQPPDDARDRCQAQPSPGEFCGEERFENSALRRLIHAAARIPHLEIDAIGLTWSQAWRFRLTPAGFRPPGR